MNLEQRFPIPGDGLGDEQRVLANSLWRFADAELIGPRREAKRKPEEVLDRALRMLDEDLGLWRAAWPEAHGGLGQSLPELVASLTVACEQLGRADCGLGMDFAVFQALSCALVHSPGCDPGGLERAAGLLVAGSSPAVVSWIGPQAEEPRDPGARLRAEDSGSELRLHGAGAMPINSGALADVLAVEVMDADGEPMLYLLSAGDDAVVRRTPALRTGLADRPNARVDLCAAVPLGGAPLIAGGEGLATARAWLCLFSAAVQVGALLAADGILADWGENRVIKGRGQVFRDNPLAASTMGELPASIAMARGAVYGLAGQLAKPDAGPGLLLLARTSAARVGAWAAQALDRTMELMGSAGYAREWLLERHWRDVQTIRCALGPEVLTHLELARFHYGSGA